MPRPAVPFSVIFQLVSTHCAAQVSSLNKSSTDLAFLLYNEHVTFSNTRAIRVDTIIHSAAYELQKQ